ncbi:MAG TPA: hypothetical protein DCX07_01455 [Phycisphaerales bacterium]|nr:hypothetical protein [Phycisphaerales bacterium]
MAKRRLVTLLTDFGLRDGYVASVKGVILGACPSAEIVDICHDVPAHDVLAGAYILAQAAPCFPSGTLHVAIVDPTVGTDRRILAMRLGGQEFLVPDNGIITMVARGRPLEAIFAVRSTQYVPSGGAARTFHGRDVFAPVAAHLLNGLEMSRLGPVPETYRLLELPEPAERGDELVGQVIHVDRFGNCVSNIEEAALLAKFPDLARAGVACAGRDVGAIQGAYAFVGIGSPLALVNSMGLLEVAVNQGRACDALGAGVGSEVRVGRRSPAAS